MQGKKAGSSSQKKKARAREQPGRSCCTRLLMSLIRFTFFSFLIFTAILLIPIIPPGPHVKFTEFQVAPPRDLEGVLALNTVLNNAEKLFEGEIKGPEAFTVLDGELYTTLHGGYVAKVYEDQIIPVVKFGQPCEHWWEERKCGRPLGIRATNDGHLIVADAYYGLFKYNVNSGKITTLVERNTVVEGKRVGIFNSVEIAKDGTIYWTDSSSDFELQDGIYTILADGSGRLIKYDPKTKRNTVLIDGLYFANGIALSPEEDFIVVAETGHSRLQRYWLTGPKKLTSEVFIDGLPGLPDNLRPNGKGGFFVPLVLARDAQTPVISQVLAPFPSIRKIVARSLSLIELFFSQIEEYYPNYFCKRAVHFLGHFEMMSPLNPPRFTLLEVDVNGNIVASHHALDGSLTSISDVVVHDGSIWFGSPYNNYLGRIKLSKLQGKFVEEKGVKFAPSTTPRPTTTTTTTTTPKPTTTTTTTPKPSTTTPKPTTTTPKPTTTTPKPTTTTPKPTTTTPKPTTTTPKPTTTTAKTVKKDTKDNESAKPKPKS